MSSAVILFIIGIVLVVLGYPAIAAALATVAKVLFLLGRAARLQRSEVRPLNWRLRDA